MQRILKCIIGWKNSKAHQFVGWPHLVSVTNAICRLLGLRCFVQLNSPQNSVCWTTDELIHCKHFTNSIILICLHVITKNNILATLICFLYKKINFPVLSTNDSHYSNVIYQFLQLSEEEVKVSPRLWQPISHPIPICFCCLLSYGLNVSIKWRHNVMADEVSCLQNSAVANDDLSVWSALSWTSALHLLNDI